MYLEIQNQFPNDIYAKTGLAEVLKAEGNIQGAKEMYLKIQNQFPNDIYSKHALVVCYLISNELISIDKSIFVTSNPKSRDDYYFYHSYIMYNIGIKQYSEAEILILNEINTIPFYKTKVLFNQTLIYLKLVQKRYKDLLEDINSIIFIEKLSATEHVFKTHIYSENSMQDDAIKHLNMIKHYPTNSIFYTNATLLSERYDLNGLPRKGLDNRSLDKLIVDEEFKLIGVFV